MRYTQEPPTEEGYYIARGFKIDEHTQERSKTPAWEIPLKVFRQSAHPDRLLRYYGPTDLMGFVDTIGVYNDLQGGTFRAYDVEWARIPTPEEPGQEQNLQARIRELEEALGSAISTLEDIEEPSWSGFGGSETVESLRRALAGRMEEETT